MTTETDQTSRPVDNEHPGTTDTAGPTKAKGDADPPKDEKGGPKGKEPTRYGDWESKGIAWDF
ncbi:MAG: DUF1674 domain-containing protein [Pacificimonas sp.]|jgi:hypothetical protein|nr:DUF1674 domain-containing protein [Pacificimonas sp.]